MDAVPDNVFALETTTYRHRSPTWKYYEAPNKKDRTAVCKLCNETLSFKSSISNLKKHLKRRHNMFTKNGSGDEDTNETYLEEETEDKRASEKFPRTSVVWKHYEVPDREERTAECKYCKETLSYKSGISNLKKHLLRKHDSVFKNDSDDEAVMSETYLEDDEESVNGDEPKDKRRSRRSGVWEYFDVTDEEQRTANCQLCSEEFSYRSTSTNLVRHLQRKHGVVFMHSESDNDKEGDSEKRPRKPTNNRTSIAWDYFTIKNPDKKLATCKVCTKDCSYFTSTSNLLKHVRRAHGIGYMADDEPDDEEETQVKISRSDHARRSTVWAYFKHLDRASCLAVCLICKKKLSYLTTITNLKRHLIRKHPQLELDGIVDIQTSSSVFPNLSNTATPVTY
ncbi:hypothetical protein evm_009267 [Chilo suppressalis]|nr:hypothetical protein evm_009267 [Chilo suppressalis]